MIRIAGIPFDTYDGEIQLPKRSTHRYNSPVVPYGGIQVMPISGPAFTLRLTRFAAADTLHHELDRLNASVGNVVPIIDDGIVYEFLPYRLLFAILDVQIVESSRIVHAAGSRDGIPYSFSPAAKVVANITFQAVPI